ncbi:MAG: hypothetical protein JJU06_03565 [Ectothiorhodospiraceae bacterium]|nr:hypothetical protein [Ectothiorhodospiraceae bacterium]MCH8504308.1 hypothetical protein [Ectothiorhodospiraceae bacterium]
MKMRMLTAIGAALLVSHAATAGEIPTREGFFADADNQAAFEMAQEGGQIDHARSIFQSQCGAISQQDFDGNLDCACFKQAFDQASDEDVYFEAVSAYQIYEKQVAAMQAGDQERAERLGQALEQREGLIDEIGATCAQ